MNPWMLFDLLPSGPVEDASKKLRKALARAPESAARDSIPKLRELIASLEDGDVTLVEGLGVWLRSLRVDAAVKAEIEVFLGVCEQHADAVTLALEPALDPDILRDLLGG